MRYSIFSKKTFKHLVVFAFVFFVTVADAQEKLTLEQAIERALTNNLQIKRAQLNQSLSEQNLKESKLALLPTLNADNNLNFNFGRSVDPFSYQFVNQQITSVNGGVFTGVTLFQGGQKLSQISQNKYLLEADKSNTQKAKNDLALNVATAYLAVINNQDLLTASQQQLEVSKLQLARVQKQFDVGNNTLADLSQSKSQVATSELNVTNAQNQLDLAYLNLSQYMEAGSEIKFEVVRPVIDEIAQLNTAYSAADVYTKAVQSQPDIKIAEFNTLAAQKGVNVARGSLYPRLNLQGSLGSGYSSNRQSFVESKTTGNVVPIGVVQKTGDAVVMPEVQNIFEKSSFSSQLSENFNQTIGFSLSIPVFNGYTSRFAVKRAKIRFQDALVSEQLAKNTLSKVISQAVLDLRASERSYYSAQSAYESSKDAFHVIEQRYNVGLVNSLDFNQAQTNLNKAQFDMIQAKYTLIFRSKVIDFYLGNPLTF